MIEDSQLSKKFADRDLKQDDVESLFYIVRNCQVMLDRDLAMLYQVETGQLNRQVKRNIERFPSDFMFQLTKEELANLKCQFGMSSWGGDRHQPYAFTESGIAMLSGVLRSEIAVSVNIRIMRAFVAMRHFFVNNAQYPAIDVARFNRAHDRFLLIDEEVYHIGASIKDLGKKWFGFTLMQDISAREILNKILF